MQKKSAQHFSPKEKFSLFLLFWLLILPVSQNWLFRVMALLCFVLTLQLIKKSRQAELESFASLLPKERNIWHAGSCLWFGLVGAVAVGLLTILEIDQPFYFMQVDNHSQFLPVIVSAARGLFDDGNFPTWNGYQFLGVPTSSMGYYALTYPPTYFCYAVARFMLGNEYLTLEVFIWLHLLAGYYTCYLLLRHMSVRPSLAASGSFCFVMLGFNILFGAVWYYITPTVTYLPLLGLSLISAMRAPPGRRWLVGTALTIGLYFHSGNVQMWSYAMLFWGLCFLWILACNQLLLFDYLASGIAAVLGGLAVAAPLLVVQSLQTDAIPRSAWDINIALMANSLLFPWVQANPPAGDIMQYFVGSNPVMIFSGGIFAFVFFIRFAGDVACLYRLKNFSPQIAPIIFSALALLALTLAMGSRGILWNILAIFPPFSKFRIPLKLAPFMTFFMLLSSVPLIETFLRKIKYLRFAGAGIGLLAVGLLLAAYEDTKPFVIYADNPYLPLPQQQARFQARGFTISGRVAPFSPYQPDTRNFSATLALNYPTVYQIPVTKGYYLADPLESGLPENRMADRLYDKNPMEFFSEFGVEWVTVSALAFNNNTNPHLMDMYLKEFSKSRNIYGLLSSQGYAVQRLGIIDAFHIGSDATRHMAYTDEQPTSPLPYRILTNGIDIKLAAAHPNPASPRKLTANFLYRPWIKAWSDSGEILTSSADTYGRIAINVPLSVRMVSIRYCPPWKYGFLVAGIMLFPAFRLYRRIAHA